MDTNVCVFFFVYLITEESRNKPTNKPECTEDSQCPALEACINAVCQDPCALSHICGGDKQCTVLGTVPLRTMICRCPEGNVPDENGKCIKIRKFFSRFKFISFQLNGMD